jgi:ligand-binding sensor domain-containing protein/two-component sensor histidine kinase
VIPLALAYVKKFRLKNFLLLQIICFVFFFHQSCKRDNRKQDTIDPETPKITEAKTPLTSKDSIIPTEIIPIRNVKVVPAGKPVIILMKSNISPAGIPEIIAAGTPISNTSGEGIYKLPAVVPAIGKIAITVMPEVVPVKDATIKDDDPANFSSYKILQGLKHPLIESMMQDRSGNIWFGTYSGGVSKYDGKFFTNYTTAQGLSNDGIWSMLQDSKGNCWFGTLGAGLSKYDGKTFTNYNISGGYAKNVVWSILEDKSGNLWFGTNNGVTRYNGNSFTQYTTAEGLGNNFVHSIIQDRANNIWFGTLGGVSKFDGKRFSNYTRKQGLVNDSVLSLMKDKKGNIWIGTDGGVTKFDGKYFLNYTSAQGFSSMPVQSMLQDKSEKVWFGTSKGIILFDENLLQHEQSTFTHYTTEQGLGNDNVISILEDRAGNLWFGTNGGGAERFDGRTLTHFTTSEGLGNNAVMRTVEDEFGNLWFGTWGGGVSKYDGKSFTTYSVAQGLGSNDVFSLLLDRNGFLWLGTGKGVSKFDGKTFTNYAAEQGMTNDQVWSIMEDKAGDLWFGSFGSGIFKYDGKTFTHFVQAKGLNNGIVMCIIQDRAGIYWFGTYGDGVTRYDGLSFTHYTTAEGLSSNEVMDMLQDKRGDIWLGTIGGGVDKFDGKFFTNYSTAQGLSNEIVMGILEDKSGNLWFSTRNGINRMLDPSSLYVSGKMNIGNKPIFKNYIYADGFLGVNCYLNSLFEDSKGNIWAGAGDRLTCYHPEGEIPDTIPPNIQLSNLALFNENINWLNLEKKKDTTLILGNGVKVGNFEFDSLLPYNDIPANLSLAYNNNYLSFKYVGITTQSPYKVRYKYKLDGLDENWSGITDRTEASYGNLPFGKYAFKVRAMNSEGYWSNELNYPFTITPPWWKTIWFRSVELLLVILIFYSIYRYRLNQILKLQAIRNKIAHDLHDDIGSTLHSISIYSQIVQQDPENKQKALEMIGDSSRKVIDTMSDIVWAINPDNDSFENIILRMRSLAFNLLRAKNIEFTFRADEKLNHIKLSMETRRNFFLIFKESLNNLVKYSEATLVSIQLFSEDSLVKLIIRDNGNGFDPLLPANGNGLNSMRHRAKEMKAQIKIDSVIGEGTGMELFLKL